MPDVKVKPLIPKLVLFLLFSAGTALWAFFVTGQMDHERAGFQFQLERLGDDLLRVRLEGRLGPGPLPPGVRAFGIYGPDGKLAEGWGPDIPRSVGPGNPFRDGRSLVLTDGQADFLKVLIPLGPRMVPWGEEAPGTGPPPPPPPGAGYQGFLFLRVGDHPLEARLETWFLGGWAGTAAWAGLMVLVGVLWSRSRKYRAALAQNRELVQFAEAARTLGHELQNPLAAILLQTALLTRASGGTAAPEVRIIEEEARRISTLVTRVRDFLKDPAGVPERIDLGAQVRGLLDRFPQTITLETDSEAPVFVVFEPQRLRSVLENLLKNALESGPDPRPAVRITRPRPGVVRLEVLDSGLGFTPSALARARDPFFTTKAAGTGIGLPVAEGFIRAAGGRMTLANRQDGGARVTIDLPEPPQEQSR